MERFFVYYDSGRCNDGDHASGLEDFATYEEAIAFLDKQRRESSDVFGMTGVIIKGVKCTIVGGTERGHDANGTRCPNCGHGSICLRSNHG